MKNTVKMLRPNDYFRIGEHESWFTDMAAKGLHLRKMGPFFATFEKGEPKQMKHRIEIAMKRQISEEQEKLYYNFGWDRVTSYNDFLVFSSPVELNVPEIHTDPIEQSYTIQKLKKKTANSALMVVMGLLIIVFLSYYLLFWDGTPLLELVDGSNIILLLYHFLYFYGAYLVFQTAISIRKLQRDLHNGIPINHHAPWKKFRIVNLSVTNGILLIFILLFIALLTLHYVNHSRMTLPEKGSSLPIVRLAEIENTSNLVRETHYTDDFVDFNNSVTSNWSPFAPVQYETREHGYIPEREYKEDRPRLSLETKVYKLRLASLSDNLVQDLIESRTHRGNPGNIVKPKSTKLDTLLVYEKEYKIQLYATKGKGVMYLEYTGTADLQTIIEEVEEKLSIVSE